MNSGIGDRTRSPRPKSGTELQYDKVFLDWTDELRIMSSSCLKRLFALIVLGCPLAGGVGGVRVRG